MKTRRSNIKTRHWTAIKPMKLLLLFYKYYQLLKLLKILFISFFFSILQIPTILKNKYFFFNFAYNHQLLLLLKRLQHHLNKEWKALWFDGYIVLHFIDWTKKICIVIPELNKSQYLPPFGHFHQNCKHAAHRNTAENGRKGGKMLTFIEFKYHRSTFSNSRSKM